MPYSSEVTHSAPTPKRPADLGDEYALRKICSLTPLFTGQDHEDQIHTGGGGDVFEKANKILTYKNTVAL